MTIIWNQQRFLRSWHHKDDHVDVLPGVGQDLNMWLAATCLIRRDSLNWSFVSAPWVDFDEVKERMCFSMLVNWGIEVRGNTVVKCFLIFLSSCTFRTTSNTSSTEFIERSNMYSIIMTAALVSLSSGRLGQDANVNQMAGSFALHADTKMNFKDAFYFCKEKVWNSHLNHRRRDDHSFVSHIMYILPNWLRLKTIFIPIWKSKINHLQSHLQPELTHPTQLSQHCQYTFTTQYGTGLAHIQNSEEAKQVLNMVQAANCGTGAPGTRNTWIGLQKYYFQNDWYWIQGFSSSGSASKWFVFIFITRWFPTYRCKKSHWIFGFCFNETFVNSWIAKMLPAVFPKTNPIICPKCKFLFSHSDGDCDDFWRTNRPVDDPERECGVIWHKATEWDNMMGNGWCDRELCFVCAGIHSSSVVCEFPWNGTIVSI